MTAVAQLTHSSSDQRPLLRRLALASEPWLYSSPALILIIAVMLVPLALGVSYAFRDVRLLNPFSGGFVGLQHFEALASDKNFARALKNTLWWAGASVFFQFTFGLILALLLDRPFRGRAIAQALVFLPWAVPSFLSGLNWAWLFNPVVGPLPHWLVRARPVRRAEQHPVRSPERHVGPDHRQCLVGHPVLRDHAAGGAAGDPARSLRGGLDRRRQRVPALLVHHPAVPGADHRHHHPAAHGLDLQLRRPHHRDDQRRPGRPHPDRRQLHLHPGLPAARFRLRLRHRARACCSC